MRRAWFFGLLVGFVMPLSGEVEVPAPPERGSQRGLSPAQREAVQQSDREAQRAWEERLTEEQKRVWQQEREVGFRRERDQLARPGGWMEDGWRAQAERLGFGAEDLTRLERDKLFIEDLQLKQSFEGYTRPRGPVFVTSDVMLNAFHVLFEDSFHELELRRVGVLREELERLVRRSREQIARFSARHEFAVEEVRPGWEHLQRVVGPALRLLGTAPEFFDEAVRGDIEAEVARIRAAKEIALPQWLEPTSRDLLAIDYRRMRPVGFYVEDEQLADSFRAVRWLQSVPFRMERDRELVAMALMGTALDHDPRFFGAYGGLLGRPDDPDLTRAVDEFQNFLSGSDRSLSEQMAFCRRWLLREEFSRDEWGKLNDAVSLPLEAQEKLAQIRFRVMSAFRLPESLALAGDTEAGRLPRGLVVAALLGSKFAEARLGADESGRRAEAMAAARADWHPGGVVERRRGEASVHDRYLDVLATLAAPAEADAPGFMRGEAWAAKSCQTILAGWAQQRHTFTLQAKEDVLYFGLMQLPPGFVEPNPVFFGALANLVQHTEGLLSRAGGTDSNSGAWRQLERMARRLEAMAHKQLRQQDWSVDEAKFLRDFGESIAAVMGYAGNSWMKPNDDAPRWATVASDPRSGTLLAVAVGRARPIHVLYPWHGHEVLCHGAIMTYYEYTAEERLTDAEWKARLDSEEAPMLPDWIEPIVAR